MLYAQVTGSYDWRCPNCNHQNRHRVNPLKFTFKCRNTRCEYTHVFGVAHWKTLPGRKTPPPDQMVFEAGFWGGGSPPNVLVFAGCGWAIAEPVRKKLARVSWVAGATKPRLTHHLKGGGR